MSEISKYLDLAEQYGKRKKTRKKAIECWEKILEINPNYIVSWIMMGKNYEKLKQADKAMECYDKALEIEPTHRDALRYKEQLLNPQDYRVPKIGDGETKIFEITQFKYVEKNHFVRFTCTNEKIDIVFPIPRIGYKKRQIIIKWSDIDTIKITRTVKKLYGNKYYTYWFDFIDKDKVIRVFQNETNQFRRKELRKILPRLSAYMKSINKTYIQNFDNEEERFYRNIPRQFYTVVVPAFLCTILLLVIVLILIPK